VREETLVVLRFDGERVDTSLVHLPAPREGQGAVSFEHIRRSFPPTVWPSACGQILAGYVYAREGILHDAPICPDCQAAVA
jgi:hypothetical protein